MPEQPEQASNWLEEAAATEPKPEPVVEAEVQEEAEPAPAKEKVEKVVPLAALHEERAKRREIAQRESAMRMEIEQLRRQQLEYMARQPQPQAPDPTTDPVGALTHGQAQTQQQIAALAQQQFAERQVAHQRAQVDQFVATVRAQNDEFVKQQPDANDAINFLKSSRVDEYKAMGMSHQEASHRMLQEEVQLSQWALANGENPAAVAYRMAEARGYTAPAKKLEMQSNGQKASMPSGSGKGGGLPSLQALLQMDSKDFAKATEGDNWAKLMKRHGA